MQVARARRRSDRRESRREKLLRTGEAEVADRREARKITALLLARRVDGERIAGSSVVLPSMPHRERAHLSMQDPHCHASSISIACTAEAAFDIMSNGLKQGRWALGSMNRREVEPGIFLGQSVFTGKDLYVRLDADRTRLLVDYEVGPSREAMQFRHMSRVIPGPTLKMSSDACVVTLLTWRLATQSDADWIALSTIHEAEMFLIKGLLERGLP